MHYDRRCKTCKLRRANYAGHQEVPEHHARYDLSKSARGFARSPKWPVINKRFWTDGIYRFFTEDNLMPS